MATVRDLISRSLRLIQAIGQSEVPDTEEANDALDTLNDMLDAWGLSPLMLPFTASAMYSTVPNQKVYSIGAGGDWNGPRPININYAMLRLNDALDIPIRLLENQQYGETPMKGILSPQPTSLYYEAQYPLGFVSLYPVPSEVVGIVLSYSATFAQVTLDTPTDTLAPGLRKAIRYNLAVELAPEYDKAASASIREIAKSSLAAIKSANLKPLDAVFDPALPGVGTGRAWDYRVG